MDRRTIMTRAKSGALPVPSAATSDVSDDEDRQSDSQPGGSAVEEHDGDSPNESGTDSGGDGSCAQTVDSRVGRAATDNLGQNATLLEGGVQASATTAAGVHSDATTSVALESSTESLARQQPPALLPSGPKPRSNPHQG